MKYKTSSWQLSENSSHGPLPIYVHNMTKDENLCRRREIYEHADIWGHTRTFDDDDNNPM